ncbi:MAG: hypothetical protein JXQ76_00975 [Campylobacterales bacterium]|nr:hypothetical protein [Campylobacterales bacterium]
MAKETQPLISMNTQNIIQTLKMSYPRDVRKGLVKSILAVEKSKDTKSIQQQYHLLNQIFSYVLKECDWSMPDNSQQWDKRPLEIMLTAFPKLDTTQWYQDQALNAKQNINVVMEEQPN